MPGPLLSGQRDPPIGALGPALGRWILAPHTHRASLPRFAARADWLQYRTPKPNQRLQQPLPPPLPPPRKMANSNKGELGLPLTASAQAPQRPRPHGITPPYLRSTAQAPRWSHAPFPYLTPPSRKEYAGVFQARPTVQLKRHPGRSTTQALTLFGLLTSHFSEAPGVTPLGVNAQAPFFPSRVRRSPYACPRRRQRRWRREATEFTAGSWEVITRESSFA